MTPRHECPDCGATRMNVFGFYCEHRRCPMMSEQPIQTSDRELVQRLDKETYDQKRAHGFDAPDDAEVTITFGTLRMIERLLDALINPAT
jgi:hypothetical protein